MTLPKVNFVGGEEDLVATVDVDGKKCRVLVDTGSQISLITRCRSGTKGVRPSSIRILGVTGHKMWNYGEKSVVIRVSDVEYEVKMQVVDSLGGFDAIVGLDFLRRYQGVIDVSRGVLKVGRQKWPLIKGDRGFEREEERVEEPCYSRVEGMVVRLTRIEKIPPQSEKVMRVPLSSEYRLEGLEVMTEPCCDGVEGCAVARGVCRIDESNQVVIQVANFGGEELVLQKGTLLATLSEFYQGERAKKENKAVRHMRAEGSNIMNIAEKLRHLSDMEADALAPVLEEYMGLFCPNETPPATDIIQHHIPTGDAKPIYQRPYRTPHHQKPLIEKFVREQLEAGIIKPSESPWSSPIVIVPKKSSDGKPKYRFCVDFRRLNAVTIPDVYPIPNIADTLDHLGGCTYFTTLDLTSGYYQISMHPESQAKTGFIVESGHYEYTRMPFGLRNAPATFQKMMDGVLRGLKPTQCMVYLDDVIVFSNGIKEHAERLRRVFEKLREAKLSLKFEKCHFALAEVKYLGHIISREGVHPDPEKIEAVKNFPIPSSVKELQSFLGLSNYYRRFVDGYAEMARPLTRLLKKGTAFTWTPECQEAMRNLKDALTQSPVLVYPDFSKPFILSTDASNFAIGAVLSQERDGEEHPCAYASRQLSSPEVSYATTEKELLAVVWGVNQFRWALIGQKFRIVTDHAALKWLFSLKDPSSRLLRWALKLGEYEYEVVHKPGKKHLNADALSRKVRRAGASFDTEVAEKQKEDENCLRWRSEKGFIEEGGILRKITEEGAKVVVPNSWRSEALRQCHDHPLAGHMGVGPTVSRAKEIYWWPTLRKDCEDFVKNCVSCQQRSPYGRTKATLQELPATDRPFDFIAVDIVGPFPRAENGDKYILSIMDHFSRYLEMVAIPDQTAETVAAALVRRWVLKFGVPEIVLSDQGTNFMSGLFSEMCTLLKVKRLRTSSWHPETNGRLERVHRTIAKILSHYVNCRHTDWNEWLPYAVSAYNSSEHSSTGFSPHQVIFGYPMRSPFERIAGKVEGLNESYVCELGKKLSNIWGICRKNSKQARSRQERQYNKGAKDIQYAIGQWVYLRDFSAKAGQVKKLKKLWKGPYEVIEVIPPTSVKLRLPNRELLVHKNRLKPHPSATAPPPCKGRDRPRGRPRKIPCAENAKGGISATKAPSEFPTQPNWEGGNEWGNEDIAVGGPRPPQRRNKRRAPHQCDRDEEWVPGAEPIIGTPPRSPYRLRSNTAESPEEEQATRDTPQQRDSLSSERADGSSPSRKDKREESPPSPLSPPPPSEVTEENEETPLAPRHPYALRSLGPPPSSPSAVHSDHSPSPQKR
jgi:transposase InsO family protein